MSTDTPDGQRLAKAIARAGLASRRDAERMIAEGRVDVNGKTVDSPALNVTDRDRIAVDGKPLPAAEAARLWLYHKPAGLVTTERDEKDRETVFDALRDRLGRVLSVGRLDLTSEGLLLLTNDGDLKRRLELPQTGWLRRYRVRVNGRPDDASLQRLRDGITVEGENFGEMQVSLDRQQGANAWLTIGLREGRNREIRRAAEAVGLAVNRLIRVSYGPFQLGQLAAGEVEEIKPRVLRDQLGTLFDGDFAEERRQAAPRHAGDRLMDKGRGKPGAKAPRGDGPRKPRGDRADARPDKPGKDGPRTAKPPVTRNDGKALGKGRHDGKPGDRPARAEGKSWGDKPRSDRPKREGDAPRRDGKPWGDKPRGDRPKRDDDKPGRDGKPRSDKPRADRPRRDDDKPRRDGKPGGERPRRGDGPKDGPRGGTEEPKRQTKTERKAAMRADTSVSLRKGGQRGRGVSKPKPAGGKTYTKPTKPKG